jgi:hypothetical protein
VPIRGKYKGEMPCFVLCPNNRRNTKFPCLNPQMTLNLHDTSASDRCQSFRIESHDRWNLVSSVEGYRLIVDSPTEEWTGP